MVTSAKWLWIFTLMVHWSAMAATVEFLSKLELKAGNGSMGMKLKPQCPTTCDTYSALLQYKAGGPLKARICTRKSSKLNCCSSGLVRLNTWRN